MTKDAALIYCDRHGIMTERLRLAGLRFFCAEERELGRIIVYDDRGLTDAEAGTRLFHEIGHLETGAFYRPRCRKADRSRAEYRARRWAAERLLPKARVKMAIKKGYTEPWEIAELFGVEEALVRFACGEYFNK